MTIPPALLEAMANAISRMEAQQSVPKQGSYSTPCYSLNNPAAKQRVEAAISAAERAGWVMVERRLLNEAADDLTDWAASNRGAHAAALLLDAAALRQAAGEGT